MATESQTFVAATQKWVMNRIQEVKNYVLDVKASIVELITELTTLHDDDMKKIGTKFAELADKVVTGEIHVQGEAAIDDSLTVNAGISSAGVASSGPICCTDPAGLLIKTPGRTPTGLNSTTLSLINERGKVARFFLRGDKLCYDYEYDKIYTCFEESTGASLKYLTRRNTTLASIVNDIDQYPNDSERMRRLEPWFSDPDGWRRHPEARLFNRKVHELFPSLGTPFMIPESMWFSVPPMWKLRKIKLVDSEGKAYKVLHDFPDDMQVHDVLINFPYIRSENEMPAQIAPIVPQDLGPTPLSPNDFFGLTPIGVQHIGDFYNGYYEVTDPDAKFHESDKHGLIPNVILRLNEFPKDQVSVIYFDVVHA